ncbi:hypothetical protein KDA_14460 [Dictyobacter alpinus]|uniref:Glycosyltransferase RgtA/B/C/D-like domain-containing protein n=1 Tax=Dictyobacter alpinus TaxID=2014873 RepID=A0A402B3P1_9CHLR|nr:hypothetical protein [Dictyobacter alpinus]GCE25962.1 hypothetical protein KDA_14460 [Dictyobacter alpinus]
MKWLSKYRWWNLAGLIILAMLLLWLDRACYQFTLPVTLAMRNQSLQVHAGSTTLDLGKVGTPQYLVFADQDPVLHEYQMDGTDSTNNFSLDSNYFHQLATSPYYRFQAWMRDLAGTSMWRDLRIERPQQSQTSSYPLKPGASIPLPSDPLFYVHVQLQRPETPRTLTLVMKDHSSVHITLNRNDRFMNATGSPLGLSDEKEIGRAYFPQDPLPFAAMVLSFIVRTLLWSLVLLILCIAGDIVLAFLRRALGGRLDIFRLRRNVNGGTTVANRPPLNVFRRAWMALINAVHPFALMCLLGSLCFVLWIARVQYHGMPHIYDANAYFFAAKIYAHGQLAAPLPPAATLFPGPFMLQFAGQWFAQYPLGTALTLTPGMWLGHPWVIEPLCGTLALLGSGFVLARLYNRQIASLAVILGTLSPFYSYLAASYLSHAIALFYLVWGWWALLRFLQGGAAWNIWLASICFGLAALTRDLVGILWIVLVAGSSIVLCWSQVRLYWRRWWRALLIALGLALCFVAISLGFNLLLTHNIFISPRTLFYAADTWGFGPGIGFYGQHTLAAGLVNLDELLTSLAIDLYGWPFYTTLAFIAIPFITRQARLIDWLLLGCLVSMVGAYVGYFYHGIYLGPRYLFETLPFLLCLTARGIITLALLGQKLGDRIAQWHTYNFPNQVTSYSSRWSLPTALLVGCLLACNLIYYLPRQTVVYKNYSGAPISYPIDVNTIYQSKLHNAIVVTSNSYLYQMVLFPLNDPAMHSDVIYALAGDPTQYAQLQKAFPGRKIYQINIIDNGAVQYEAIDN